MRWTRNLPTTPLICKPSFLSMINMTLVSTFCRLLTLAVLLAAPAAHAQGGAGDGRRGQRLAQLENAKIAFITTRVSLTQDQAQKFWPLYNEFSGRRRELNRNGRLLRRDVTEGLTDAQIRDNITQSFALRQQELTLEKDYFEKFQRVISLRQVAQLLTAERDFTKEVIKRVAGPGGAPRLSND